MQFRKGVIFMVRILFVEDSKVEIEKTQKFFKDIKQVMVFFEYSAENALKLALKENIDIFFLDFELTEMSGFELASKLRKIDKYGLTQIVFTAEYPQNSLEIFKKYNCYDFIGKPFLREELKQKIRRLIEKVEHHQESIKKSELKSIFTKNEILIIPVDEILYIGVQERICKIYFSGHRIEIKDTSLKQVLLALEKPNLMQCHKSFAINLNEIEDIKERNYRSWQTTLRGCDAKIDITKTYYYKIFQQLNFLLNNR